MTELSAGRRNKARWVMAVLFAGSAAASQAALLDAPVPGNATITFGGLQWAWANVVAADGSYEVAPGEGNPAFTGIDLSYQAQFGWRLATAEELAHAPKALDFIFDGANVPASWDGVDPVSGAYNAYSAIPDVERPGAMACAAAYFSAWSRACNWQNGPGTGDRTSTAWWQPSGLLYAETVVVREIPAVPEPATQGLLLAGLAATVAFVRHRRR